jgi:small subunit ribosomal protein S7
MSRSGKISRKLIEPDPVFGNRLLTRLTNRIMKNGKKSTAQTQVYRALELIKAQGEDPIKIFETAINNVGPKQEVRSRRVGGASYQVPTEVRGERKIALAIRWIIQYANKRSNKEYRSFDKKLSAELLDAAKGLGESIKKRDTVHRMAEANKAFAHFRW